MAYEDAQRGRAGEFEALLREVLESGYRTALRLTGNPSDAEDLLQDASLLALKGFASFRVGSNFKAWFFRILFNRFYSVYRRGRRRGTAVDIDEAPEGLVFDRAEAAGLLKDADPIAAVFGRLDVEAITGALLALPDDYRAVATLYFTQDFSYQDIAQVLEVPVGTVRSRLHRARRVLRRALWETAVESGIVGSGTGSDRS
jgi:RNA polymerase sigma-70 factor (ECF subfamily)